MAKYEKRNYQSWVDNKNRVEPPQAKADNLTDEEIEKVLLEALQISPRTSQLARRIFQYTDDYSRVAGTIDNPEIRDYVIAHPDVPQIIRLGFYTRVISTCIELLAEANKFIENPETNYTHPKVVKRYKNRTDLAHYIRRYRSFGQVVSLMIKEADSQVGGWMTRRVKTEDLSPDNAYFEVVSAKHTIGDILVTVAKEFSKKGIKSGHNLDSLEYANLVELCLSIIKQEAAIPSPTIDLTELVHEEKLSKIFFDLSVAFEFTADQQAMSALPNILRDVFKEGLPLYRVLYGCIKQIPEALVHDEHPGHPATARIVDVLNDFSVPERDYAGEFKDEMFNFMLCAAQIQLEYAGHGSFQEYIVNIQNLASKPGPNQEWYQGLLDFMVRCSMYFPHKVISQGKDIHEQLFDLSRGPKFDYDLSERIIQIMEAGNFDIMETTVDERQLAVEETVLRGEKFDSLMQIHRFDTDLFPNFFLINMMITIAVDKSQPDRLGLDTDMTRFCCQVRVNGSRVSVFIPVAHLSEMHPDVESAIVNHAKQVLSMIDVEALRQRTAEQEAKLQSPQNGESKLDRKQRKEAYQRERQKNGADEEAQQTSNWKKPAAKPPQQAIEKETRYEEYAKYVPQELVIHPSMLAEMQNSKKKGSQARINALTLAFFEKYNKAGENKPGQGMPFTAACGPAGERIWRFRINYDDRCLVVEVGGGKAVLVMAGKKDDVYRNYGIIAINAARALDGYEKEQ